MLVIVEIVFSKQTIITVHLVLTFTIDIFEYVYIQLVSRDFEFRRVDLKIGLTTPSQVMVMFKFVRAIIF